MAALFGRSLLHSASRDLGFDPERVAAVRIRVPNDRQGTRVAEYYAPAVERALSLPGVENVAVAAFTPFGSSWQPTWLQRDGRRITVLQNRTSADYFKTMGIEVVRGRTYTSDEVRRIAPVGVITAKLAQDLWGSSDPIGGTLERVGHRSASEAVDLSTVNIIGVVGDVLSARLSEPEAGTVYLPLLAIDTRGSAQLVVRTAGPASAARLPLQEAIGALDPSLHVTVDLTADAFNRQLDPVRTIASLASGLGALALGLAVVGMFGVTTFVVGQRLTEVSIRMAIGATGADILQLLLRDSLRPVFIGGMAGLGLSLIAGQFMASVLYGISPRDPIAIATAIAVLVPAATGAVLVPTRRAARVDPARVLRQG
jgi:hypothetical protein